MERLTFVGNRACGSEYPAHAGLGAEICGEVECDQLIGVADRNDDRTPLGVEEHTVGMGPIALEFGDVDTGALAEEIAGEVIEADDVPEIPGSQDRAVGIHVHDHVGERVPLERVVGTAANGGPLLGGDLVTVLERKITVLSGIGLMS